MKFILNSMPYILKGFGVTVLLSIFCIIVSVLFGILTGIICESEKKPLRGLARIFITVFRGIPSLVVLYMVFFLLPEIGLELKSFPAAVIGLSFWGIANVGESIRGAIESLPKAQFEASAALGLSRPQTFLFVILPQAFRRVLPSLVGIISNMVQNTSLATFIGTTEFLKAAQYTIERIQMLEKVSVSLTVYGMVMLGYFLICFPLSLLSKQLESRLRV